MENGGEEERDRKMEGERSGKKETRRNYKEWTVKTSEYKKTN